MNFYFRLWPDGVTDSEDGGFLIFMDSSSLLLLIVVPRTPGEYLA